MVRENALTIHDQIYITERLIKSWQFYQSMSIGHLHIKENKLVSERQLCTLIILIRNNDRDRGEEREISNAVTEICDQSRLCKKVI